MSSKTATSPTVRAIGPTWSRVQASGNTPNLLTRPYVGFSPTIPQHAAGMRIDPDVSEPSDPMVKPVGIATPAPPLDPPAILVRFHGFLASPKCGFSVVTPSAYSCRLSLPTKIAPADSSLSTAVAPVSGTNRSWIFDPIVVIRSLK